MCLTKAKRIRFKKDIVCYKMLLIDYNFDLYSPYQHEKYFIGETKVIDSGVPNFIDNAITGNAIHTYKYKRTAIRIAKQCYYSECCIVKCIIPKNSEYVYKGYFGPNRAYACQKLFLDKIIYTSDKQILSIVGNTNIIKV